MYARVPTFKVSAPKIDASVMHFEEGSLPELRKIPGFKGGTVLVDREKGVLRIVALWESREALGSSSSRRSVCERSTRRSSVRSLSRWRSSRWRDSSSGEAQPLRFRYNAMPARAAPKAASTNPKLSPPARLTTP